jgi:hypothetical protein
MVKVYDIKAKIEVQTYNNKSEDITRGVTHLSVTKTLARPSGQFQITLLPIRDDKGASYYYRLSPMDYISIAFARFPENYDELPPVMRGFIDNVNSQASAGNQGEPNRRYMITGRDYGKIFQICQIYYMFFNAVAMMQNRLMEKYNIPMDGPPKEIIEGFFKIAIDQLKNIQATYKGIPDLQVWASDDLYGSVHTLSAQQWDRDLWGLMTHFDNAPWNELYLMDFDKPTLVFRKTPWIDADAEGYIQGNDSLYDKTLKYIRILPDDVITMDLTRSDAETRNYFYCYPQMSLLGDKGTKEAAMLKAGYTEEGLKTNPYVINRDDEYAGRDRYGFRYFEWASEYFDVRPGMAEKKITSQSVDYMGTAEQLNKWLVAAMKQNSALESGQFVLKGNENIKPGYYLQWQDGVYYVEQVRHDLCFVQKQEYFRTTALVTRGTNYLAVKKKLQNAQSSNSELYNMNAFREATGRF